MGDANGLRSVRDENLGLKEGSLGTSPGRQSLHSTLFSVLYQPDLRETQVWSRHTPVYLDYLLFFLTAAGP